MYYLLEVSNHAELQFKSVGKVTKFSPESGSQFDYKTTRISTSSGLATGRRYHWTHKKISMTSPTPVVSPKARSTSCSLKDLRSPDRSVWACLRSPIAVFLIQASVCYLCEHCGGFNRRDWPIDE